jgi:hypothetical protein
LSVRDLIPILEEALNGEEQLAEDDAAKVKFRRLLEEDNTTRPEDKSLSPSTPTQKSPTQDRSKEETGKPEESRLRKTGHPGRPNPSRPALDGPIDDTE